MTNEAVEMEPSGRVLPIFRGEYDADRTYENPDIVLFRNSSYVAKQVTVGNPPPTDALADDYWQMVAKGIIDADVSDSTIEFTEATKRSNIESGEKSNIIMGKIMKFFTDLKDIAFSGRYSDLSDKPISITEDGNDSIISLEGGEQRSIGLINQLQAVNFKNEGGGPNQGMKFVTRQPSTGDIVFGNLDGDTDLMFPFSFGIDENGDYGYKKFKTNKFTPFGNVYTKNVLNTTEQISANTASGNIAGALAAKAMMADYNAKINQINSNLSDKAVARSGYVQGISGSVATIKLAPFTNYLFFAYMYVYFIQTYSQTFDLHGLIPAPEDFITLNTDSLNLKITKNTEYSFYMSVLNMGGNKYNFLDA